MINWFRKIFQSEIAVESISDDEVMTEMNVDMHSHLLPGIDDGSKTMTESIEMIKLFNFLGYKKLITTPHVMFDSYKNNPEKINNILIHLKDQIQINKITLVLEAAAEYYIDENFYEKIGKEDLLTFGNSNYILVETSMNQKANIFESTLNKLIQCGYHPVLAHPERYSYFYNSYPDYKKVRNSGVLFQLNILSLSGYYSAPAKKIAEKLIDDRMIDFMGTDAHNPKHLESIWKCRDLPYYKKLINLPLLNNTI